MAALCTIDDIRARTGEAISEPDEVRLAEILVRRASAAVNAAARRTWNSEVDAPETAVTITIESAARGYMNPAFWEGERGDTLNFTRAEIGANGIELTRSEVAELIPLRPAGITSVGLTAGVPISRSDRHRARQYDYPAPMWDGTTPFPLGNDWSFMT